MNFNFSLDLATPCMAKLPTALPWQLAGRADRRNQELLTWLQKRFEDIFPQSTRAEQTLWAKLHVRMLGQERIDAMAFHRLGHSGGPAIALRGIEHARSLAQAGKGFILVLNHFDRLLTAPIALAQHGIKSNVLTMPVLTNPDLDPAHRRFLLRKINRYTEITGGLWHTTDDGMRTVHESLRAGQAWVILADAWRADFARLRPHSFLGGFLQLPTGIERLARSTGVPLLHAATYTHRPDQLEVMVEPLPDDPEQAIDQVIQRLHCDVQARPWAWWHWGLWDQMWHPAAQEVNRDAH